MLPILLKLGPITIYSYGVFMAMGLFTGLYWFWKIGRDEHWDETQLFDTYFASTIVFFVVSRLGYVLFHPEMHTLLSVFAIFSRPGISVIFGLMGVIATSIFIARKLEWDIWKMLDVATVVIATIFVVGSIGAVLNGSMPGIESMNLGYVHPGDVVPRLPLDILTFFWSLISFGVVSRVRKNFRFYGWYKGGASVAKDGLTALVGGMLFGTYLVIIGLLDDNVKKIFNVSLVSLMGTGILLLMSCMIYMRIGRNRGEGLLSRIIRKDV
ncbi:MAG: hypothetical protein E6R05_06560 [Candidatus Moraniibacteriota bacterium]|nr:MAG: hypothetical protein E6R05_06560 [Candidatus Moranbacteria bacterium]